MDSFGEPTHVGFDFLVRALRPTAGAALTLDGSGPTERLPDPGGFNQIPTNLTPAAGVAIVAYATDPIGPDGDDIIRFVLLSAIGSGTQIFFTDRNWSGTAFAAASAGEGTFTYTAGADLPAGTVVTITSAQLLAAGMDLSNNGETIYVYQGTDANTPTTFLYAMDVADDNTVFEAGELTGTGLTAGVNAVAVAFDQGSFAGQSTQIAQTQLAAISNNVQWHGHSGDDIGGTIYDDRADVTLSGPLTNPDMQIFGVMSGGGQSDAFIRMDNEEASNVATNLTRLFRDNPNFTHLTDLAFDIEDGFWFAVDNDGTTTTRILRGNIADLVSGTSSPTITVIYDFPNDDDNVPVDDDTFIDGIEIDTANNRVYFIQGEIANGHSMKSVAYTGGAVTDYGLVNFAHDQTIGIFTGGIFDFVLDVPHNTAYFTYVLVDTNFNPPRAHVNYLVKVNALNNAAGGYSIVPINGPFSDDPDGAGTNPANHFPDVANGSLAGIDIDIANQRIYFVTQRLGANGQAGIFMYDIVSHNVTLIWQQQSNNATNTLQPFPTTQMEYIEVDTIGGRYYVSTLNNTDTALGHDGTATDEGGSRIFSGSLTGFGVAPTVFASAFENTANGAVLGMEIDYAPTLTVGSAGSTYTESTNLPASPAGPTVDVATSPAVNDADQAVIKGATVAITTGFVSGDQLTFTNSGGITGSYNATTGVVTFTGNATFAQYQTVLDSVRFTNAGDNPTNYGANQSRTITFTVTDGLLNSDPATATVLVVGINDAPVNTPGAAATVNEDSSANTIAGVSVFDVDANPATQDIVVTLSVAHGTISVLTNVAGGIIGADITGGANGSGTITITATQNQINATLAAAGGLTYTPTTNYNGADALTIVTNDQGFNGTDPGLTGTGSSEQDTDNKVINITPVNDAPTVVDATQTAATILEDTPSTLGETVSSLFTASFSDALDQQQTGGNPTGSTANTLAGIAVVGGSTGANGSWEYFNGSIWVPIGAASTASAVLISAATAIRFNPALNFNGSPPDLVVHLVDSSGAAITNGAIVNLTGATGGTTRYSTATVALSESVTAVNDAPVNTVGGTLTVAEDSGATAVTGMSISDVDANPATDVFTVTLDVLHGSLNVLTSVPGGVGAGNVAGNGSATVTLTGTINQINATLAAAGGLTYTPTGNYNGSDRVQITTDDGGATGLDPGATGTATSEADIDSKTINVTAVNDPVTGTAPASATLDEDSTNVAISGMSISDIDATLAPAGVYVVTLSSTNGTMTLTTLTGLTFSAGDGTADVTMTFRGTLAAINTALATASYTPTGNYNGSATITLAVTDTFGGTVATGTGAATSDSDVINVTVTAVNDPVSTNAPPTATIDEDAVNAAIAGLSISDIDATLAPAGVYEVTLSASAGSMTMTTLAGLTFTAGDGTSDATMTFHGTLAAINTALATATYTPPANYNGPAQITLSATDTYGAIVATGTGAATNDSDVVNVTVNAVNDTPVVNLAATLNATEQVASTIDAAATVSDVDLDARNGGNGDYAGAQLVVARSGAVVDPNDLFSFGASGAFTVNGSNLEAGGLVFASFTVTNSSRLDIFFNSSGTTATTALVNAVLQSIQYTYTGDNPPPAGVDLTVQLNDGAPGNAGQGSTVGHFPVGADTIHVNITDTPENVAPTLDLDGNDSNTVGTGYTASFTEGGAAVLITDTDVAIADVDAGDMIEGATITINSAIAGDQLVLGAQGGFVVTGSGTGTITITGTGTAAQYEAMLEQITFSNGTDDPGTTRTINITVTDGTVASNIAVATINIAEVNDEPTLAATAVNPTFTEGGAAVDLFSGVTADTIEAGQTFVSLTLTVTNVTDGANEILVVGGMNVTLTNGNVVATPAGNVTVTLVGSTATVVVGPSTLSEAALQTLIDGLAYLNTSENPTDANRVVTITQLVDSGSDTSPSDATLAPGIASTVDVNPINDTPITTVPGTQTINEDASVTLSNGNGNAIQVADADATTLTVTLTVLHGTLTLASTASLSFGTGDGTADATMTFSGTAAAINAALGSGLTYNPNADFNGSDSIAVFTTDNGEFGGPAQTDSDTVPINITAINDAPVVIGDGTESATTINEDTPGAGQTIDSLFAGQYSDAADNQIPNGGASSPGQFSGIAVTANGSSAATGQWQYFSGGVWTDIGAASDAAAKLLGDPFVTLIRFNPALNYNGPAPTLTVHLIDNSLPFGIVNGQVVDISGPGATGGTTAYSTGTVVLSETVTAVNDAPVNTVPGTQTINEDAFITFSSGNGNQISIGDVDAGTGIVTVTLDIDDNGGSLFPLPASGATVTGAGTNHVVLSGTLAQINGAINTLIYQPAANANGPFTLTITTEDNGNTGTGGNQIDIDTVTININSVNDAPSGANNTLTGSEDDPLVLTAADFGFSDPVEGNAFLAVIIDTFPANGTLFLDMDGPGGNPPVDLSTLGSGVFVNVSDINLGRLYFQPDPDEFGNGYAQFNFRVQDDGGMLNGGVDRDPVANTIFINIQADNLPPVVDLDGVAPGVNYTTTFVEDGAAVAIGSGVLVSDPDSGLGDMIESATITLTDRVAGDSLTLSGALPPGIVAVTTPSAGAITIQITGPGTGAQYQALIQSILYATTSQDPTVGGTDLARTITVTVNDGTISSAVATTTVNVTAVDDAPLAQPDAFTITESGSIAGGNLFADNGSGADTDPDGPPLTISAVNGSAGNVNTVSPFTLPSGASLQVFSNGTFNYNPNTAYLPTPTAGSGASNTPGHDSFTYTLAGGNTVTVSITLTGLDTDDTLLGTAGADILMGGNGNDFYFVENSSDQVIEALGQGYDRVFASVSYALAAAAEVEVLSTVSWGATTAINLTGNAFGNVIYGNAGANTLNGGGGTDVLIGFAGDDNYFVDSATDAVIEDNVPGLDSVFSSVNYGLAEGSYVEVLSAVSWGATTALSLAGNSFANIIYGNAGANTLNGGGGADVLIGFGGDDAYIVDNAGDVVIEAAGQGYDTVYALADHTLAEGTYVEVLSTADWSSTAPINLTGNSFANTIYGNAGANILNGGGGTDTLVGLGGNDTYYVDSASDSVIEAAGGGNDSVYASSSYTLGAGQEIEFLSSNNFSSTTALNLTGNELANTIYGNAGVNILDGKGGNDALVGLDGADVFAFTTALGAGNVDLVFGFVAGSDKIALDDAIFGAGIGTAGAFNANAFHVGAAAHDLDDRIIYNSATGQLFFDADGSGAGVAVQFATLSPGLTLTASDFQVI